MPPNQNKLLCPCLWLGKGRSTHKLHSRDKKSQAIDFLAVPLHGTDPAGKGPQGDTPCPIPQEGLLTQPPQQAGLKQAALGDTQAIPEVQESIWSPLYRGVLSQAGATCCSKLFSCFCSAKTRASPACKGSSRPHSTGNPVLFSARVRA